MRVKINNEEFVLMLSSSKIHIIIFWIGLDVVRSSGNMSSYQIRLIATNYHIRLVRMHCYIRYGLLGAPKWRR